MLSWQTSTAVQLSNPSAVDCVHVAFLVFFLCRTKAKQRRSRNYSAIKALLAVFSVCPLLREPLHRPMCAARSTTRMLFQPTDCGIMEHKGINDKPHAKMSKYGARPLGECCASDIDSLLRAVPTDYYLHPRIYSSHNTCLLVVPIASSSRTARD